MADQLTHITPAGDAVMVDVGAKAKTRRVAKAQARVIMQKETLELIQRKGHKKGDVLAIAQIAGIQAAKKTWDLIPLCHPLLLDSIKVTLTPQDDCSEVWVESSCSLEGKTGVEMEALTAVSVAALTLYDMCKAVDKGICITDIKLIEKAGGRSGHFIAD